MSSAGLPKIATSWYKEMRSGEEGGQKEAIWTVSAADGGKARDKERKKMRREKWEQEHLLPLPFLPVLPQLTPCPF